MANHWRQTKRYRCPSCRATVLHDESHAHYSYECPARPRLQSKPAVALPMKTERDRRGVLTPAQVNV